MESQAPDANAGLNIQTTQNDSVDTSAYKEITKNFAVKSWALDDPMYAPIESQSVAIQESPEIQSSIQTPIQIQQVPTSATANAVTIQAFSARSIPVPTFDLSGLIMKAIVIIISGFPVILLFVSVFSFLIEISFNVAQIGEYPAWATLKLEEFVKSVIIPHTK